MSRKPPIVALVDDDKIFQFTASKMIRGLQLTDQILQFENGEEALKFLVEHADKSDQLPDCIFLDINMPFVDGWMFLQDYSSLKDNLSKNISIFMVSSSIDPRDIHRARAIPDVREYVTKPVSTEKFRELLQRAEA
jgi:Response regulator containing a CheY-like receiver domain and an HD-GYP domain